MFGVVINTLFDELQAEFSIEGVQDESVHLPKEIHVPLEDLYPTIEQENSALNVDLTADCLDRFRFFYNYIFMPFDHDINFVGKHLQDRMKLFFDLKNKRLSKALSSHLRKISAEAKYIQQQRENLEDLVDASIDEIDISQGESRIKARRLIELYLRMKKIKHEFEIMVNPEMREIFEEMKFPSQHLLQSGIQKIFAVTMAGTLSEQIQILEGLKQKVKEDVPINWLSMHDAISSASCGSSEVYIPAGEHSLNSFLEYLNGDILICGLPSVNINTLEMDHMNRYAKIYAAESGSMLFASDGNLTLENLIVDCEYVKTGFVAKDGELTIKNCFIYGSKDSSVTEGFSISGAAKVVIESSVIMNFATAISADQLAQVIIRNSVVKNCNVGVHLLDTDTMIAYENTSFLNCDEYGILKHSKLPEGVSCKPLDWDADKKTAES